VGCAFSRVTTSVRGQHLARLGEARLQELGEPYALAFSPDGKLLVTSDDSGNITEWDVGVS
jgi:WD40 repeat protein